MHAMPVPTTLTTGSCSFRASRSERFTLTHVEEVRPSPDEAADSIGPTPQTLFANEKSECNDAPRVEEHTKSQGRATAGLATLQRDVLSPFPMQNR